MHPKATQSEDEKPLRILACPDRPSWAFDNIANNISKFSGNNSVSIIYMKDVIENTSLIYEKIFLDRIDLCHIFWREDLFFLLHPHTIGRAALQLNLEYDTLVRAINGCAFTTSVYDHLFSGHEDMQHRRTGFAIIDGYTVSSRKLHSIYTSEPGLPPPDVIIHDGVDTERFSPRTVEDRSGEAFSIGWAGNSEWGHGLKDYDIKGFHRLFRPMMKELGDRGIAVKENVADREIKAIPFDRMPEFYRGLDLFVCTSAMEGTPNTVLEAMACGIPIVSSDVGIVPEAFGDLQGRFIIGKHDVAAFADAVSCLLADSEMRAAIARENRSRILDWSWGIKTRAWWPFWEGVLNRSIERRNAIRREFCLLSKAEFI